MVKTYYENNNDTNINKNNNTNKSMNVDGNSNYTNYNNPNNISLKSDTNLRIMIPHSFLTHHQRGFSHEGVPRLVHELVIEKPPPYGLPQAIGRVVPEAACDVGLWVHGGRREVPVHGAVLD